MDLVEFWTICKQRLSLYMPSEVYSAYIAHIRLSAGQVGSEEIRIRLELPTRQAQEYIELHWLATLYKVAADVQSRRVHFELHTAAGEVLPEAAASSPLNPALSPSYRFENFLVEDNNRQAYTMARAMAKDPTSASVPTQIVLQGAVGSGKTHLVQAICHALDSEARETSGGCVWTQAISIASLEARASQRSALDHVHVLLIDDIQALEDRPTVAKRLAQVLEQRRKRGQRTVLATDRSIRRLTRLPEELQRALRDAFQLAILPANERFRERVVRVRFDRAGIPAKHDVIRRISKAPIADIRILEGLTNRLIAVSALCGQDQLTDRLVSREIYQQGYLRTQAPTLEAIASVTASVFQLSEDDLKGPSRRADVVIARHCAIYLSGRMTRHNPTSIAAFFMRDESTIRRARRILETHPEVSTQLREMQQMLTGAHSLTSYA